MRGRKPKPTKLKLIEGNPGHRPLPQDEPQIELVTIEAPTELQEAKNENALKEWNRIAPILKEAQLITEADKTALMAYCLTYQRWLEAEKNVRQYGVFIKTKNHYVQINPYMTMVSKCLEQMRGLMVEFGLTPSSRVRLNGAPSSNSKSDPFSSFLHEANNRR